MCINPLLDDDVIPADSSLFTKPLIFELSDLVGRTLFIRKFSEEHAEMIVAVDTSTGDVFCLKETIL